MRYNERTKRFEDEDGRAVDVATVLALIHGLKVVSKRDAKRLAARLQRGEITVAEFEAGMQDIITSTHIVAASVGKGGIDRMTDSDWREVADKIEWQEGYLSKWAKKIAKGVFVLSAARLAFRAYLYLSAPFISFSSMFRAAQLEPVLSGPGVEGRTTPPSGGGTIRKDAAAHITQARLIQNSKEGCSECKADAAKGWMPVDDMGEIGSRICGDYCLCEIEFR